MPTPTPVISALTLLESQEALTPAQKGATILLKAHQTGEVTLSPATLLDIDMILLGHTLPTELSTLLAYDWIKAPGCRYRVARCRYFQHAVGERYVLLNITLPDSCWSRGMTLGELQGELSDPKFTRAPRDTQFDLSGHAHIRQGIAQEIK